MRLFLYLLHWLSTDIISDMTSLSVQRRFLLKISAACATAPASISASAQSRSDQYLGGARYQEVSGGPAKYLLSKVEPRSGTLRKAVAPFFPHGFAFSKANSSLVFAFEKIGLGAALFDIEKMQMIAPIEPVGDRLFYGHGVVSADGKLLFSTETSRNEKGAIGVRDAKTLAYLGDFPSYGLNPHDCQLIEGGRVLLITNGGGDEASGQHGSLCYVDVQSQRLLERAEMADPRFNTGHVLAHKKREAIVVSAPRKGLDKTYLGAISAKDAKGAKGATSSLKVITQPIDLATKIFGEALSIAVMPERDLFAVTHPTPGMVTIWQLSTLQFKKQFNLISARGLALSSDKNSLWVSYGLQAHIIRIDLGKLQLDETSDIANTFITGSHLVIQPLHLNL